MKHVIAIGTFSDLVQQHNTALFGLPDRNGALSQPTPHRTAGTPTIPEYHKGSKKATAFFF